MSPSSALLEQATFTPSPVLDRDKGIVRDVRVLGRTSRNRKTYSDAAMDDAVRLFEGAVVYTNHPPKEFAGRRVPRNIEDRFARLNGLYKKPDGVYAKTLHYNTGHPLAESFAWNVENDPKGIGISINGRTDRFDRLGDGSIFVRGIDEAFSADLVDTPATGEGLFEQYTPRERTLNEIKGDLSGRHLAPSAYQRGHAFAERETIKDALLGVDEDAIADRDEARRLGRRLFHAAPQQRPADLSRIKAALLS